MVSFILSHFLNVVNVEGPETTWVMLCLHLGPKILAASHYLSQNVKVPPFLNPTVCVSESLSNLRLTFRVA